MKIIANLVTDKYLYISENCIFIKKDNWEQILNKEEIENSIKEIMTEIKINFGRYESIESFIREKISYKLKHESQEMKPFSFKSRESFMGGGL